MAQGLPYAARPAFLCLRIDLAMPASPGLDIISHPYFAKGATWAAEGWYRDEHGYTLPCEGMTRVAHGRSQWSISTELRVLVFDSPLTLRGTYDLNIPEPGDTEAFWTSEGGTLGPLAGRFTVIDDTLMISAFSEDGRTVLLESLFLTEDDDYLSRGNLMRDGDTVALWSMTLTPVAPAPSFTAPPGLSDREAMSRDNSRIVIEDNGSQGDDDDSSTSFYHK